MWDQHGGFLCDREGNLKKEWCWKSDQEQEKIVVKVNTCVFRFAEDTHAKARCCALEAMNSSESAKAWQTCNLFVVVAQLAKGISLRLLSGTTALLSFKCEDNKVQLPLSVVPSAAKEAVRVTTLFFSFFSCVLKLGLRSGASTATRHCNFLRVMHPDYRNTCKMINIDRVPTGP